MEREYIISPLTLLLAIIGSLFTFAAVLKIVGDTIAALDLLNERDILGASWIFIISWVTTMPILVRVSRSLRTGFNLKTALTIGIVISSILFPLITLAFSPTILFGSVDFDIKLDYIDIIRNLTIGTISVAMMWRWERSQHSA